MELMSFPCNTVFLQKKCPTFCISGSVLVLQANIEELPGSREQQNRHLLHKALAGVKSPNQLPAETTLFLQDEGAVW